MLLKLNIFKLFKLLHMKNFWNDQISPGYYDRIIEKGIDTDKGIQANWHNITFSKAQEFFNGNEIHLDYACGSGTFIGIYVDVKSIGVDISNIQINYAKKKYPRKKFIELSNFDFEKYINSFDVVTIFGLMEFISPDEASKLLEKVYRVLKKDGKLIISTPNFSSSVSFLSILNSFFGGMSYSTQQICKYNKKSLEKLIKSSSFTNYKIEKIINLGIVLSFFSISTGKKVNDIITKITKSRLGFLLMAEIKK